MTDISQMKLPWTREPCSVCGVEGSATRAEPKPLTDVYTCDTCAAQIKGYERGYLDGMAATHAAAPPTDGALQQVAEFTFDVDVKQIQAGDLLVVRGNENPAHRFTRNTARMLRQSVMEQSGKAVSVLVLPPDWQFEHLPGAQARQLLAQLVKDVGEPEFIRGGEEVEEVNARTLDRQSITDAELVQAFSTPCQFRSGCRAMTQQVNHSYCAFHLKVEQELLARRAREYTQHKRTCHCQAQPDGLMADAGCPDCEDCR